MSSLTPIQVVNSTTDQWRVDSLSANLNVTVINGTLSNGTLLNGRPYNGNDSSIRNITVIERVQPSAFGSLTVTSFIYLLMSLVIILLLSGTFTRWVRVAIGQREYKYTMFLPTSGPGDLNTREFDRRLRRFYRGKEDTSVEAPSYAEMRPRLPTEDFSPQGLREFRELIRAKYAMDVKIWNHRHASVLNQPIVDDWRNRSRGATLEMLEKVERWTQEKGKWTPAEWTYIEQISQRIRSLNEQEGIRYEALADQ